MSEVKIVQIAGGPADAESEYTGPERELRVDTGNHDLRIHDGVTPGGHLVPNRDNNDERYQPKSNELSGIGPFTAEMRGFLTRRGAGEYRLRRITVSSAFTIVNPDGYDGDVGLSLSGIVSQDMVFEEDVRIDGALSVIGGMSGDLNGNFFGNSVGNYVGNIIGNMQGNVTGNLTGKHVGAIDARNFAVQFSPNSLDPTWVDGLVGLIKTYGVPIGGIIAWSGSIASIPVGWSLCDGTNGTPNLRDRFIIGAGNLTPGDTGGDNESSGNTGAAGSHDHGGSSVGGHTLTTSEMPTHSHSLGAAVPVAGANFGYTGATGVTGATVSATASEGGGGSHNHPLTIATVGNHTHSITLNVMPPYFALAFIMHIGP